MAKIKYFENIPNLGDLYLINDKDIIVEFEMEPVIFFCKDNLGREYYCHTIDFRYDTDWFIYRISKAEKERLLNNKISIRTAFKKARNHLYYYSTRGTKKKIKYNKFSRWMPKDGVYVEWDEI